jgi:hypothetical protein
MKLLIFFTIAFPLLGLNDPKRIIYTGVYKTRDPYQGGRLNLRSNGDYELRINICEGYGIVAGKWQVSGEKLVLQISKLPRGIGYDDMRSLDFRITSVDPIEFKYESAAILCFPFAGFENFFRVDGKQ